MIGVVLAAGAGRRLQPLTDALPKTLLPVAGEVTILDLAIANLAHAGVAEALVVTGFAADRIAERVPALQERFGVQLRLVFNDRAEEWNNAYSLWLAREAFAAGVLLINGDTVHPAAVEDVVLAARGPDLLLAVDRVKPLGEEEMKVVLAPGGRLQRITKRIDPRTAHGEYIGVAFIGPAAAGPLADALAATWRRDPSLYYEDGFQELVDRGGTVSVVPIGTVDWVEVDNHADLARAREIACHY